MLNDDVSADRIRFEVKGDRPASSSSDVSTDFSICENKIDLSLIDANTSLVARGDQASPHRTTAKSTSQGATLLQLLNNR